MTVDLVAIKDGEDVKVEQLKDVDQKFNETKKILIASMRQKEKDTVLILSDLRDFLDAYSKCVSLISCEDTMRSVLNVYEANVTELVWECIEVFKELADVEILRILKDFFPGIHSIFMDAGEVVEEIQRFIAPTSEASKSDLLDQKTLVVLTKVKKRAAESTTFTYTTENIDPNLQHEIDFIEAKHEVDQFLERANQYGSIHTKSSFRKVLKDFLSASCPVVYETHAMGEEAIEAISSVYKRMKKLAISLGMEKVINFTFFETLKIKINDTDKSVDQLLRENRDKKLAELAQTKEEELTVGKVERLDSTPDISNIKLSDPYSDILFQGSIVREAANLGESREGRVITETMGFLDSSVKEVLATGNLTKFIRESKVQLHLKAFLWACRDYGYADGYKNTFLAVYDRFQRIFKAIGMGQEMNEAIHGIFGVELEPGAAAEQAYNAIADRLANPQEINGFDELEVGGGKNSIWMCDDIYCVERTENGFVLTRPSYNDAVIGVYKNSRHLKQVIIEYGKSHRKALEQRRQQKIKDDQRHSDLDQRSRRTVSSAVVGMTAVAGIAAYTHMPKLSETFPDSFQFGIEATEREVEIGNHGKDVYKLDVFENSQYLGDITDKKMAINPFVTYTDFFRTKGMTGAVKSLERSAATTTVELTDTDVEDTNKVRIVVGLELLNNLMHMSTSDQSAMFQFWKNHKNTLEQLQQELIMNRHGNNAMKNSSIEDAYIDNFFQKNEATRWVGKFFYALPGITPKFPALHKELHSGIQFTDAMIAHGIATEAFNQIPIDEETKKLTAEVKSTQEEIPSMSVYYRISTRPNKNPAYAEITGRFTETAPKFGELFEKTVKDYRTTADTHGQRIEEFLQLMESIAKAQYTGDDLQKVLRFIKHYRTISNAGNTQDPLINPVGYSLGILEQVKELKVSVDQPATTVPTTGSYVDPNQGGLKGTHVNPIIKSGQKTTEQMHALSQGENNPKTTVASENTTAPKTGLAAVAASVGGWLKKIAGRA